jgi:hypothetical protein
MTEPNGYDDDIDDDSNDGRVTLSRQQIRQMEKDAKEARKAREEADSLRRELAFTRAGVGDLTERQQKALFATIDGDITPDAVRTAAEELGFAKPAADTAESAEQQQMQDMAQASAGAQEPGSEDDVARLLRADREGGRDAVLAELQRNGVAITPGA